MSNISDGFDPNRGAAPPSLARTRPRGAESAGRAPAFRGALDHANRDLDVRRRRAEASDDDVVALDVMDARERLDRSGHRSRAEQRGVPRETSDDRRERIMVNDGPAYRDATRETQPVDTRSDDGKNADGRPGTRASGGKRWRTTLLGEPPSGDIPVPAGAGASIPPPPIPGSATRRGSPRQTLSYAVRSPASGRTEIPPPIPGRFVKTKPSAPVAQATAVNATHRRATAPPRRVPTGETRIVSDGEVTRLWSRPAMEAAAGLPPAPQWRGTDAPEPPLLQVEAPPVRHKPAIVARVSTKPAPARSIAHPDDASAIVSGPLRAYAAVMSSVTPSASALGSPAPAPQGEPTPPAVPELANAAVFGEATDVPLPAPALNTIGEPVSANIDLSAAALDQLAGTGVPPQGEHNGRIAAQGRVVVGRMPETVGGNATEADPAVGRMGPQRAEVVIGAGANKIGLAITTVGSHVMVEALVPNDSMADTMRNELDDLRSALDQHDLELSDLTFGEATHDSPGEREPAANEDPSANGSDEGQANTDTRMNAGVRVVA
ncbi:MAG: hypothetical protein JKY37_26390 [Nannocystaceae bacterium]|nr:hypothetical protein [Nannocystaceae bacterium]